MNRLLICTTAVVWGWSIAVSSSHGELWRPPWDPPKAYDSKIPLDTPFIYDARTSKLVPTLTDALALSNRLDRVSSIKTRRNGYRVYYTTTVDLTPVFNEDELRLWTEPKHQYAFLRAFEDNGSSAPVIRDGLLLKLRMRGDRDEETARRAVEKEGGEVTSLVLSTNVNGRVSCTVEYRVPIDLKKNAQRYLNLLDFAYTYSVADEVDECELGIPIYSKEIVTLGRVRRAGWDGDIQYVEVAGTNLDRARAMISGTDAPLDFDHEVVGKYMLHGYCRANGDAFGRVVVETPEDERYFWPIADNRFIYFSGDEDILDAYLNKFPSILPVGYRIDYKAWGREEVARSIQRLETYAGEGGGGEGQASNYFNEYLHLCRLIEPIDAAPLIWSWVDTISGDEERYHLSVVSKWWEKNSQKIPLRYNAPANLEKVKAQGFCSHNAPEKFSTFRENSEAYWRKMRGQVDGE